ncbi:MAG: CaiB/BaiF CoA-transferase family protein [Gammaproteobacteria bacterium]|nr:CaiB/BaiF CoA-transferase family protein [Gammaproteobacteria bacterium]
MEEQRDSATGALDGVRVLDLSRVLAGPWASQILADLGADVVKIERPGDGDETRHWGPPYLRDGQGRDTDRSAYFLAANRNKRSVTLDLANPEGQAIARDLAAGSDVLLENFKAGGLARYGLDYATLSRRHPGLVYCSITGFGQHGPYRDRPGYDFIIQAMGGLMSVTGEADGMPGGGPQKAGVALADVLTGLNAAIAVLAALRHRDRTGEGQWIDLALLDVQVASLANQASNYLVSGVPPGRLGNAHPNIVPYQAFATSDGHLVVAVGNDGQFRRLCTRLGASEWADDPRFATNAARVAHRATLVPLLEARFREGATGAWLDALGGSGIPCGPIQNLDDVFADPQVQARGLRREFDEADGGPVPSVASPLNLSATPVTYRRPPPRLGEHTRAVLGERLGLDAVQIDELAKRGVI